MKKLMILLFFSLLFIGIFAIGFVLADNDYARTNSSDLKIKEVVKDEFVEPIKNSSGKRNDVRTRFEEKVKDGKIEGRFEEEIRFIDESGDVVRKRVKIEVKEENGIIIRKIRVVTKTGNEIEIESKLQIREEIEGNLSRIKIKRSDGNETELKVLPDRASEIAREQLKARNVSIEIREIRERNIPKVVYHAEGDRHGKFLGIFKIRARYEAQINPETGEAINFNGPWWAFLITSDSESELS